MRKKSSRLRFGKDNLLELGQCRIMIMTNLRAQIFTIHHFGNFLGTKYFKYDALGLN